MEKESLADMDEDIISVFDNLLDYLISSDCRLQVHSSFFNISKLKDKYQQYNSQSHKRRNSNATGWGNFFTYAIDAQSQLHSNCAAPYKMIKLYPNGNMAICNDFVVGNINQNSISELWNNQSSQNIRGGLYLNKTNCDSCSFRSCLVGHDYDASDSKAFEHGSNLSHQHPTMVGNSEKSVIYSWFGKFIAVPIPLAQAILKQNASIENVIRFSNHKQFGIVSEDNYSSIMKH